MRRLNITSCVLLICCTAWLQSCSRSTPAMTGSKIAKAEIQSDSLASVIVDSDAESCLLFSRLFDETHECWAVVIADVQHGITVEHNSQDHSGCSINDIWVKKSPGIVHVVSIDATNHLTVSDVNVSLVEQLCQREIRVEEWSISKLRDYFDRAGVSLPIFR